MMNPRIAKLLLVYVVVALYSVGAYCQLTDYSKSQSDRVGSTEYNRIFSLSRQLLVREPVRNYFSEKFDSFLTLTAEDQRALNAPPKINGFTEGQLVTLLQRRIDLAETLEKFVEQTTPSTSEREQRAELERLVGTELDRILQDSQMKKALYPLRPVDLWLPSTIGYRETLVVNHDHYVDGKLEKPQDMETKMAEFIDGAQRELMLNVFDFDSDKLADALIRAHQRGVDLKVGIDDGVIKKHARVARAYEKLLAAKVNVLAVRSVGLNHQKLITRDWTIPSNAAAIDSSGNCTMSCIGRYGEAGDKHAGHPDAVPNANHLRVIEGQLPALLIQHELSKSLVMSLYGASDAGFYIGGMYRIQGPDGAFKIMAFSPSGAADNINKYLVRSALITSSGPLRMAQFVLTSDEVGEGLFARAEKEVRETGRFDMKAIVDGLQSLADQSEFVKILGLDREQRVVTRSDGSAKKLRFFVDDPSGRWMKLLGPEGMKEMRDSIRTAPAVYSNHSIDGLRINSLMHHKVIISPNSGLVMDGSFNLSNNALQNQEQFSLTFDKKMAERFVGIFDGLYEKTTSNEIVYRRALKANELVDSYSREKQSPRRATSTPATPAKRPADNLRGGACISNF